MASEGTHQISPIEFDKLIADLTTGFVGRQWLFEKVDAWSKKPSARCLLLVAEPGAGKSAFAAQLVKSRADIAAHHFCIAGQSDTIVPTNILLSIAAQLMRRVPGYAEALANVVRPLRLTIQVEISAESLQDGHVQGVVINNLYAGNSTEMLDLVLRRPFREFAATQPIVILIDSLDEAATLTGAENLLSLLMGLGDLPESLRLVMTTRHDDTRVMPYLTHLSPTVIEISLHSPEVLQDIAKYVDRRLAGADVQEALQEQNDDVRQSIRTRVVGLAEGNFLYARVLFDELSQRHLTLDELDSLKSGVDELYRRFLTRLLPEWHTGYQVLLTLFAAAFEPMSASDLAAFTDDTMGETELAKRLGILRQFLDQSMSDNDGSSRFSLFHHSFRNYLVDQNRSQQFCCSPKEGSRVIVDVCWQHHPNRWRTCTAYGIRNLVRHLVLLTQLETSPKRVDGASERLHALFVGDTGSGENSWFEANSRSGDVAGYISDLELAGRAARDRFEVDRAGSIGLQTRYALFMSSLAGIARNLSPDFLARLCREGIWTPEQATAYADSAPDPRNRAILLATLAAIFSGRHLDHALRLLISIPIRQSSEALTKVLPCPAVADDWLRRIRDFARTGVEEYFRSEVWVKLALRLPEAADDAFRLAATETNPNFLRYALNNTIRDCPGMWPPETLAFLQAIENEEMRGSAVSTLSRYLPADIRDSAIDIALSIGDSRGRAIALGGMAPFLKEDRLEAAFNAVVQCDEIFSRIGALLDLAPYSQAALKEAETRIFEILGFPGLETHVKRLLTLKPDLAEKVYRSAVRYDSGPVKTNLLIATMPFLQGIAEETLSAIGETDSERQRYLLKQVWCDLPDHLWPRALTMVQGWNDFHLQAEAVDDLVPHCSSQYYAMVCDQIRAIPSLPSRARASTRLWRHAPQSATALVQEVYTAIAGEATPNIEAFAELAPTMTGAAQRALEATDELPTAYERSRMVDKILPALTTDMLRRALRCIQLLRDYPLLEPVEKPPSAPDPANTMPMRSESPDHAIAALSMIDRIDSGETAIVDKALNRIFAIDAQDSRRSHAFSRLVPYLTESQLDRVRSVLETLLTMSDPAPRQQSGTRELLIAMAVRRPSLADRAISKVLSENPALATFDLKSLLPVLTQPQLARLATAIASLSSPSDRAYAFGDLAPFWAAAGDQAVSAALAMKPGYERSKMFVRLAGRTAAAVPHAIREAEGDWELLSGIPNIESLALPELIDSVSKLEFINNRNYRAEALAGLADTLVRLQPGELHRHLQKILAADARRERVELLKDLQPLKPVLLSLAGPESVREIDEAIRLATTFWP